MKLSARLIAIIVIFVIVILYGLAGLTDIDPGETGLLVKMLGTNRGMQKETLGTGTHWIEPIKYDVPVYNYQNKQYPEETMPAATKDGQPVEIDLSLEIRLVPDKIPYLHENVGRNYYEQVVYPALRSGLRNYGSAIVSSDQIYTAEGRAQVVASLSKFLNDRFNPMGIIIEPNVRAIRFTNADFNNLLEEKAKAAQRVTIEERKAEAAAQTAIAVANKAEGDKQKTIKEAEAEAARLQLQGEGQRKRDEEIAKGNLALYKAEAEGTRLQVNAYGKGETYASVKWAEHMGPNVKVYGFPTGAQGTASLMDLNGVFKGAFPTTINK